LHQRNPSGYNMALD